VVWLAPLLRRSCLLRLVIARGPRLRLSTGGVRLALAVVGVLPLLGLVWPLSLLQPTRAAVAPGPPYPSRPARRIAKPRCRPTPRPSSPPTR
jgi:hypothetical protein